MSGLATSLIGVLNDAHWNPPKKLPNIRSGLPGKGVSVHISSGASMRVRKAANVLVGALGDVPFVTTGPTFDGPSGTILLVVHEKVLPPVANSKTSAKH